MGLARLKRPLSDLKRLAFSLGSDLLCEAGSPNNRNPLHLTFIRETRCATAAREPFHRKRRGRQVLRQGSGYQERCIFRKAVLAGHARRSAILSLLNTHHSV